MDTSDELLRRKTRLETNTSNAPTSYMCTSKFGDPYRYIETVDLVGYSFSLHYCTMLSHRVLLCTFTVEKVLLWKLLFETSNRSSTKGSSIQPLLWVSMSDLFLSISWTVCLWFILVTTHTHNSWKCTWKIWFMEKIHETISWKSIGVNDWAADRFQPITVETN